MRHVPSRRAFFLDGKRYTWIGATWAQTGGRAFNTPTLGSELLTDGGLDAWSSATNLTSWTETIVGTSTINREGSDIHGGTYAARLDIDGSNSNAMFEQSALIANQWYQIGVWAKASLPAKSLGVTVATGATAGQTVIDLSTSWAKYTIVRFHGNATLNFKRVTGTSASLYIDDTSAKALTLSTLPATVVGTAGQTVTAKPYAIASGTQAGVISHLDSAASPANFIIAYHNGGTSIKMDKCVGGTYTSLVSATVTFASDAVIEIRSVGSNQFECWYNGSKCGLTATVSDSEIVSNTRYGLFSTYSANQFSTGLTLGGVLIPFGF